MAQQLMNTPKTHHESDETRIGFTRSFYTFVLYVLIKLVASLFALFPR